MLRKHRLGIVALPESDVLVALPYGQAPIVIAWKPCCMHRDFRVFHISYARYLRSTVTLRGWRQTESRVGGVEIMSTTSSPIIGGGPSKRGDVAKNMMKAMLSHHSLHISLGFVVVFW